MLVQYHYIRYELSFIDGLSFYIRKLWFPMRRLLRFCKRLAAMARTWVILLIIFLTLYLTVQEILVIKGLLSSDDVVTGLVSLLLTSFVLVFMRDAMTSERGRNLKLKKQLTIHEKVRQSTLEAGRTLSSSFGFAEPTYSDWSDQESFDAYASKLSSEGPIICTDRSSLCDALQKLYDTATEVESWYIEDAIVDASPVSGDRSLMYYTDSIKSAAARMLRMPPDASAFAFNPSDIYDLLRKSFSMTGILRRPWRYGNDRAKQKLLQKFLDEHGVELHY